MRSPKRTWPGGTGSSAAALALMAAACATSGAPTAPQLTSAGSAQQHGAPTSYRAPALGQGYSARDRHMADCLATYPGYDPAADQVTVGGVTQPCPL